MAFAGRRGQVPQRSGQAGQIETIGVLDHRHHQTARGGGGDAEIHVLLHDDHVGTWLRAALVDRVDLRCPAGRETHRASCEGQWAELEIGELRTPAQPVPQLHHRGHIDREELGDVRRTEGAGHHGRRGGPPDALDRDAVLPGRRVVGRARSGLRGGTLCRNGILHIRPADHPVLPGGGHCRQVDAEVLGELAHRRGGQGCMVGRCRGGRRCRIDDGVLRPAAESRRRRVFRSRVAVAERWTRPRTHNRPAWRSGRRQSPRRSSRPRHSWWCPNPRHRSTRSPGRRRVRMMRPAASCRADRRHRGRCRR